MNSSHVLGVHFFICPRRAGVLKKGPPHKPWFPTRTSRWDDFLNFTPHDGRNLRHPPPSRFKNSADAEAKAKLHHENQASIRKSAWFLFYWSWRRRTHLIVSNSMTIICDLNLLETCFLNLNEIIWLELNVNGIFCSSCCLPAGRSITSPAAIGLPAPLAVVIWDISACCIYFPRDWLVLLYHISIGTEKQAHIRQKSLHMETKYLTRVWRKKMNMKCLIEYRGSDHNLV